MHIESMIRTQVGCLPVDTSVLKLMVCYYLFFFRGCNYMKIMLKIALEQKYEHKTNE